MQGMLAGPLAGAPGKSGPPGCDRGAASSATKENSRSAERACADAERMGGS